MGSWMRTDKPGRELSSADGSTNGGGLLRGDSNGSNSDGGWGAEGLTRGPGRGPWGNGATFYTLNFAQNATNLRSQHFRAKHAFLKKILRVRCIGFSDRNQTEAALLGFEDDAQQAGEMFLLILEPTRDPV